MRKCIYSLVSRFVDTQYDKVWDKIEKYDSPIVSFDIFDTLIKRNISSPNLMLNILEDKYKKRFGDEDCNIREGRLEAEANARHVCDTEEVTLKDIYDVWGSFGLSVRKREWLEAEELRIECVLCQRNWEIGEIYDKCLKAGKKIYIISDMYLPIETVQKILDNAGYSNWSGIYLSSDKMKTKHNGSLFDLFIDDLDIEPSKITHIGDALKGDYLEPRRHGLNVIKIPTSVFNRSVINTEYSNCTYQGDILHTLINNNVNRVSQVNNSEDNREIKTYFRKLGFEVLGPILYGYNKWLLTELGKQGISKVFFLAREGTLLDRAFNVVGKGGANGFSNTVLRVSRRATENPLNGNSEQLRNIRRYLDNCGMTGKIAVCDVGWRGTIQLNLQKIVGDSIHICGFYCGLKRKNNEKRLDNVTAYLFDYDHINSSIDKEQMDCIMAAPDLFELFFLSTDGTTIGYEEEGTPILAEQDHSGEASKVIEGLQDSSLSLVSLYSELMEKLELDLSVPTIEIFHPYQTMIRKRSRTLVKMLECLDSIDCQPMVFCFNRGLKDYLANPHQFKIDFSTTAYKALFLEHIFKLKLPYVDIIAKLRKFE